MMKKRNGTTTPMVTRIKTESGKASSAQTFQEYLVAKMTVLFGDGSRRGAKENLVRYLHDHGVTASKATIFRWIGPNPTQPSHKYATQVTRILDAAAADASVDGCDGFRLTLKDLVEFARFARRQKAEPSADMIKGFILGRRHDGEKGDDHVKMP